ncbi:MULTISPECIES: ROK family protein [Aeromicrobium]|uniref:ROK family protein n=1 Tax=Aeromicrobium TaxID=2040 RepID=UPI00257B9157|nr:MULTISPECIES: ROK family protein [Aeromicrobium]
MTTPILVGLDIGGTSVKAMAVSPTDPTGLALAELRRRTELGADGIRDGITAAVHDLAAAVGPDADVVGIGVGIPGFVSKGTASHAVNLGLGAEPLDLLPTLRALTPGPVGVENDVKTAALGARGWLAQHDPGVDDYALLNIGTGLAAGMVLGGRLRAGATGSAGEIGHLVFDRSGPVCPCGQTGCLELYASGSGLRRGWSGTARQLFAAAEAGDEAAARTADDLTAGIAHAITLLAYGPDVALILVTGGVVSRNPALRAAVSARLHHDDRALVGRAVPVADRVRWLPDHIAVGTRGAALLVTEGVMG